MFTLSVAAIQRARWRRALRQTLRRVLGRDVPSGELEGRVAAYLNASDSPGQTSGPLLRADTYAPRSADDPLGGPDGLDLGRVWAAADEDLEAIEDALTIAESRVSEAVLRVRNQGLLLGEGFGSAALQASGLLRTIQSPFFGGAAPGQARSVWAVSAGDGLVYPQTDAALLGGLGCLPTRGMSASLQGISGGSVASARLTSATDSAMLATESGRAWAEDPFSLAPAAWNFVGPIFAELTLSAPVTVLELRLGPGTKVTSPVGTSLSAGGSLWLEIPPTRTLRLELIGSSDSSGTTRGSIMGIRCHDPSFDPSASLVWGPFQLPSSSRALFALTLEDVKAALPTGCRAEWSTSVAGADGPWETAVIGTPLILRANGQQDLRLQGAVPDPLSLGCYVFPVAGVGDGQGATLTAGDGQAKVDAFAHDWSHEKDPLHAPQLSDWVSPSGISRTVSMGSSVPLYGPDKAKPSWTRAARLLAGSCLGSYIDDKDWKAGGLTALVLTGTDPANLAILSPGTNYRFGWSVWAPRGSSLPGVPVGLWNPEGVAGNVAAPFAIVVNGSVVYRTNTCFTDYAELSGPPAGYGTLPSQYVPNRGTALPMNPAGASWPPYCGRVNLTFRPGWNRFEVLLYVPTQTSLGRSAALIFGPDLTAPAATLEESAGITSVRGWENPWNALSEFDLRLNAPSLLPEAWSWRTEDGAITGVLLNHDPAASETGFLTLDNVLTGQSRTHTLHYAPEVEGSSDSAPQALGAEANPRTVWVRSRLISSDSSYSPLVGSFILTAN